jgi:NAD(P)-dependent dehydrogenase (short-subunit alcohol dehydrogenase family)
MKGLDGKVVLITGAGSGIGHVTAQRLAAEGSRLALVDIDGDRAKAVAEELDALALIGDVAEEADVERYFAAAAERYGRIDALHNNAGIEGPLRPLIEFELGDFERLSRINHQGIFLNLRAMLRTARSQASPAAIVNMSSGTGLHGVPGLGAYGSTKAAIIGLTRAAAIEHAQEQIRVNAVVPGPIDTPLFERFGPEMRREVEARIPQGRLGTAEEVAGLVAFLLSDEVPYMTGGIYTVDGGENA